MMSNNCQSNFPIPEETIETETFLTTLINKNFRDMFDNKKYFYEIFLFYF